MPELHDELGQVGFGRRDAGRFEGVVEADLLGDHRLDLDHLRRTGCADEIDHDAIGLHRVAGPVHLPAVRDHVGFELRQELR